MLNLIKKSLYVIIALVTTQLIASDTREDANIKKINTENSIIFQALGIIQKPKFDWDGDATSNGIITSQNSYKTKNKVRMNYWLNMLKKPYVAPLFIAGSSRRLVTTTEDLNDLHVYTYEDLLEGDFIGEFTGAIYKNSQPSQYTHESIMVARSNPHKTLIIDATKCGNELRFIKRSKSNFNCSHLNIIDNEGIAHIIYVASRYIDAREELIVQDNSPQPLSISTKSIPTDGHLETNFKMEMESTPFTPKKSSHENIHVVDYKKTRKNTDIEEGLKEELSNSNNYSDDAQTDNSLKKDFEMELSVSNSEDTLK